MKDDILKKVIHSIAESCGIEEETIKPEYTLFNELGINSIDMLEVLFTLEMEYDISLSVSDLETESRKAMNGKEFEIDNIITEDGLKVLKERMPEIPGDKLVKGLTINGIINLMTVETLANMVLFKIEEAKV